MFQETLSRVTDPALFTKAIVISNEAHRFTIASQLAEIGVEAEAHILEPVGRNTAPAAIIAALEAEKRYPGCQILILPADHHIGSPEDFVQGIQVGSGSAKDGNLVTFGIVPTHPDAGFGYLKIGEDLDKSPSVYPVEEFVEKPDLKTAQRYLDDGRYYWNSGIFLFSAATLLREAAGYCVDILAACEQSLENSKQDLDFLRLDIDAFSKCPSDSIDYAIMEKTENAVSVPVQMGWNDVGSWTALWDLSEKDGQGNSLIGDVLTFDTKDSYIHGQDSLIATLGVDNIVVVQTTDAVLVADKSRVSQIKTIVSELQAKGRTEHESHQKVHRPWGYYESLDEGDRHQVKHISVKPGGCLSLQLHHKRSEHWVIVEGTARVTVGEKTFDLGEDESVYIPIGSKHRLENTTGDPLHLIEVQTGSYLGEDDIVRFEDVYGRESFLANQKSEK
jgi:mannose-1-phosphate guanylyltransferase/mannose-6-phosphate isomerase